jgi:UDP-glucose 4-epimerase
VPERGTRRHPRDLDTDLRFAKENVMSLGTRFGADTSGARPSSREAVLVTGGAGYIGSHVVLALRDAGRTVVVLDNLSTGRRDALPEGIPLVVGDVADGRLVRDVLSRYRIQAMLHFAGSIVVPESVAFPLAYYGNNTIASHVLLEAAVAAKVDAFVFSSTAAVYGQPESVPVAEDAPTRPLNPYGSSKLMTEQMICDAGAAHRLPYAILRYFNVAGADPAGRTGPHKPEATHLIKVACEAAAGRRRAVQVFGSDYPTHDGTCIRDFIHVTDLAVAHVAALDHLLDVGASLTLNCGYGRGHSVQEVLRSVERVSGRRLLVDQAPRRRGDAAEVVADTSRLRQLLRWRPRYDDLDTMIAHTLRWDERLQGLLAQAARVQQSEPLLA